jgi:hypothetical protein
MLLRKIRAGAALTVWAIDLTDDPDHWDCPYTTLWAESNQAARTSMGNLVRIYAESGRLPVPEKMRHLKGGDCIWELKVHVGLRILFFLAPGRRAILTHGFKKGAVVSQEIGRAQELRALWREQEPDA